jgi:hypothetical protein
MCHWLTIKAAILASIAIHWLLRASAIVSHRTPRVLDVNYVGERFASKTCYQIHSPGNTRVSVQTSSAMSF